MLDLRQIDHGLHFKRFELWWPWKTTDVWKPRVFRGADENCNPSVAAVVPFVGCVVVWPHGRKRTDAEGPCHDCRVSMSI